MVEWIKNKKHTEEIKAAEHKEYELGKTKVFIKDPQDVFRLDEARNEAMGRVFTKVQAMVRGYSARLLFYYSKAVLLFFRFCDFLV